MDTAQRRFRAEMRQQRKYLWRKRNSRFTVHHMGRHVPPFTRQRGWGQLVYAALLPLTGRV